MNTARQLLIEQALYGFSDEKLSGEDYLFEAINRYIDNDSPDYTLSSVFNESIEFSSDLFKYTILIEAADAVKQNNGDDEAKAKAEVSKIKRAINWYYRVDPDTKAKSFRTVMSLITTALKKAIQIFINYKISGVVSVPVSAFVLPVYKSDTARARLASQAAEKAKLKGGDKVKYTLKHMPWKEMIVDVLIDLLFSFFKKIEHNIYYKINVEDVDENIKKYDKMIDDINDAISECEDEETLKKLRKYKAKLVDALKELIKIRSERDRKEEKSNKLKTTAEGKV